MDGNDEDNCRRTFEEDIEFWEGWGTVERKWFLGFLTSVGSDVKVCVCVFKKIISWGILIKVIMTNQFKKLHIVHDLAYVTCDE